MYRSTEQSDPNALTFFEDDELEWIRGGKEGKLIKGATLSKLVDFAVAGNTGI